MRRREIERRIAAFPQWHYEFDLQGCKTPVWNPVLTERHAQRALHIDTARWRPFDIVFNLGLLDHVSRPVGAAGDLRAMNTDVLLTDTALSRLQGDCLEVRFESAESPQDSIAGPMVLHPTAGAVVEMTRALDYRTVMLARPGEER